MTREELANKGLSEEAIEFVMAEYGKQVQSANSYKSKVSDLDAKAKLADDLQKKLDEIETQNLSEVEKANKAKEAAEKQIAELQRSLTRSKVASIFSGKGLTGEMFDSVIDAISANAETAEAAANTFADGILKRDEEQLKDLKKKTLENTKNPDGSSGSSGNEGETESAAAKAAKAFSQRLNPSKTTAKEN